MRLYVQGDSLSKLDNALAIVENTPRMKKLSSEQVAKRLGISKSALSNYILRGKVPAPEETMAGGIRLRLWSEDDIERLRQVLPNIANGRKTRYQKLKKKKPSQKKKPKT